MPSKEPEFAEGPGDTEERVQDWAEFFRFFQEHNELKPHHNVELKEFFSLPEKREEGEIIYYYGDFGGVWMEYNEEMYRQGQLARGTLDVPPEVSDFFASILDIHSVWEINSLGWDGYLESPDTKFDESTTVAEIIVPVKYNNSTAQKTVGEVIKTFKDLKRGLRNVVEL